VSGNDTGDEYDLTAVTDGTDESLSGIAHGRQLNAFVEAVIVRDREAVDAARAALVESMDLDAMVDAAATIAAFNAFPRIADATGIPLEPAKADFTVELRDDYDLNALNHAGV
jgi:hypothetical protein